MFTNTDKDIKEIDPPIGKCVVHTNYGKPHFSFIISLDKVWKRAQWGCLFLTISGKFKFHERQHHAAECAVRRISTDRGSATSFTKCIHEKYDYERGGKV